MNLQLAKERIKDVIRPDATTESFSDFMITHVPLKRLQILKTFNNTPDSKNYKTEDEIFDELIRNEDNKHQFIIVYGTPGTGKSHLIRYFESKLSRLNLEDEVIIFISRRDNTLKGTIKQLLEKPEIANMKNKEVYERLANATSVVREDVLKSNIYHKFIIAVEQDMSNTLSNLWRKRLIAFLNNEYIREIMMSDEGPIERFYSKIAESKVLVNREVVAQFKDEDFIFEDDLLDKLKDADRKALAMARELLSEEGITLSNSLVNYLNEFKDDVIQECAGLESGDFRQIFSDIRRELFAQNKNLTLFIEDITSFSGVDSALLDVLMEENTGEYADQCRVSSIIGTTNSYFEDNFKDNHKQRVSKFIYIPGNIFDKDDPDGLYEFVSKYINAMSLEQNVIDEWVKNGAYASDYPVHDVIEGKYWDFVTISDGKELSLYPFTKNSIIKLYFDYLKREKRTMREFLLEVMEPVIEDIIESRSTFPKKERFKSLRDTDLTLKQILMNQVSGDDLERILRFMYIWGNGKPESIVIDNKYYIAGIRKEVYSELNLPVVKFNKVEVKQNEEEEVNNKIYQNVPPKIENQELKVNDEKLMRFNKASEILTNWENGDTINASSSQGVNALVYNARLDLGDFILSSIDWQCEGISLDLINKIDLKKSFILEGQSREGKYIMKLDRSMETNLLLSAFIKWREFGGKSWDFPDSYKELFVVTKWISTYKERIVSVIKTTEQGKNRNYIDFAIADEIIRSILNGEYSSKNLSEYNIEKLFSKEDSMNKNNLHNKEWNILLKALTDAKNIKNTVTNYYNLKQGSGGTKIVIDARSLESELKKVKKSILSLETYEDSIKPCKDIISLYNMIIEKLPIIIEEEKKNAKICLDILKEQLNVYDIEDEINDLIDYIRDYYSASQEASLRPRFIDTQLIKQKKKQIEYGVKRLLKADQSNDPLELLLLYSFDPILAVKPLVDVVVEMTKVLDDMKPKIENKKEQLNSIMENNIESTYEKETKCITECSNIFNSLFIGGSYNDN